MKLEDIQVGETYYVRVKVICKGDSVIGCCTVDKKNNKLVEFMAGESPAFTPIIPEKAPKYDPCRKLRKGDIVTPRVRDGRIPWGRLTSGSQIKLEKRYYIVTKDEIRNEVRIDPIFDIAEIARPNITVDVCYLELVTPAKEEIAAIFNDRKTGMWLVTKNDLTHAYFPYRLKESDNIVNSEAEAKAFAEAECARLNAEYRKEQA